MDLIGATNEAADILLLWHPLRMTIAKDDIPAISPVIVPRIREILIGPIPGSRVIRIVDNPHLRRGSTLADEVVTRASLVR